MDTTSSTTRTPRAARAAGDRGAAAVEFAFVLPVLVLFILGIIEGGTRYAQQSEVNHWAFVAARDVSVKPGTNATTTATATVNTLKGSNTTTFTTTVTPTGACTAPGATQVTVVVRASKASPTRMFGDYTLTGRSVARCEN